MNTSKTIGLVGLVAVVALAMYLAFASSDATKEQTAMSENEQMEESEESMMVADDAMMSGDDSEAMEVMSSGTYTAYSADKLAMAEEGDVVLFFKASWCPTCRALDADLKANLKSIPAGVTILEIDYDNSTALRQKYGVTTQHTLVQVAANGDLIKKWSGGNTLEATLAQLN